MNIRSGIQPLISPASHESAAAVKPVDVSRSAYARLRTVCATQVALKPGLWQQRMEVNRNVSLRYGYDMLVESGNLYNLHLAAGRESGEYRDRLASDSDVYKWVEAVGYALGKKADDALVLLADQVIDAIVAAQADDGYLMSFYQVVEPTRRWTKIATGHELYCAGHLFQAALAYHAGTGDDRLLGVASRLADHIAEVFGPNRRAATPGHPGIEMALVELGRYTGDARYIELAQFFLKQRGRVALDGVEQWVFQNHAPIEAQATLVGHAVRQMYLLTGIADLYLEFGESALLDALYRQWRDMVAGKLYLTGGLGQRHYREAFGQAYELPSDRCYCESCASIGGIMWNWRMLLATGEARFADLIERTLYNAFLGAVAMDGRHFFYVNPLSSRGEPDDGGDPTTPYCRKPWHKTACCPPNIMRMLASLPHYMVTTDDSGVQIQQFAPCSIEVETPASGPIAMEIATRFPWDGEVAVTIEADSAAPWVLSLRIPSWCEDYALSVNGVVCEAEPDDGYLRLTRQWCRGDVICLQLQMKPQMVASDPRVDATRGSVAIQHGPLVYCVEQCDCPEHVDLQDVVVAEDPHFEPAWEPDLLGGVNVIGFNVYQHSRVPWASGLYQPLERSVEAGRSGPFQLRAVPYFGWANRTPGRMRVWIPYGGVAGRDRTSG